MSTPQFPYVFVIRGEPHAFRIQNTTIRFRIGPGYGLYVHGKDLDKLKRVYWQDRSQTGLDAVKAARKIYCKQCRDRLLPV